mmetsp:Transcript_20381/g.60187  ORF Transcript_20381/g.60187 Transcript_20381/m.60187 type:complete len:300 (+) Transcript_20381:125-1024(+)
MTIQLVCSPVLVPSRTATIGMCINWSRILRAFVTPEEPPASFHSCRIETRSPRFLTRTVAARMRTLQGHTVFSLCPRAEHKCRPAITYSSSVMPSIGETRRRPISVLSFANESLTASWSASSFTVSSSDVVAAGMFAALTSGVESCSRSAPSPADRLLSAAAFFPFACSCRSSSCSAILSTRFSESVFMTVMAAAELLAAMNSSFCFVSTEIMSSRSLISFGMSISRASRWLGVTETAGRRAGPPAAFSGAARFPASPWAPPARLPFFLAKPYPSAASAPAAFWRSPTLGLLPSNLGRE